jgi:hypothetical protein
MDRHLYIAVRVYDDGDTELRRIELTEIEKELYQKTYLLYTEKDTLKLIGELESYGHEKQDIINSINYVYDEKNPDTCIVGKV